MSALYNDAARKGGALTSDRLALGCFVAYLVIAYPLLVFHFGRDEWFIHDDWELILPTIAPSVFSPVEQHWITLPILLFRTYFRVFGANYTVFLCTVVAVHLGIASLLRLTMRRAGVGPWVATVCAAPLVLFGPGYISIIFSIGLTQDSSMLLGLAQLILADHDGAIGRRDWLGLFAGALSLMCSGLAPIIVVGVALATLWRRGVLASLFHVVPLALLFLTWFVIEHPMTLGQADAFSVPFSVSTAKGFVATGLVVTFRTLGHFLPVSMLMVVILIGGTALRFAPRNSGAKRSTAYAPIALSACAPLYFAILALQRSRFGVGYVAHGHHLYTGVYFLLPALSCAVDAIVRRWRLLAPAISALFLAPIPWHIPAFHGERIPPLKNEFTNRNKRILLAVAHSPYARQAKHLDASRFVADPWYELPLGWVLDQAAKGRFPKPKDRDPALDDLVELYYGLTDLGVPPAATLCPERATPLEIRPRQGETIVTRSPVAIFNVRRVRSDEAKAVFQRQSSAHLGHALRAELPDLQLRLEPAPGKRFFAYCGGAPEERPIESAALDTDAESAALNTDADDALKKAIREDPKAMEAVTKAIQQDPKAMEAVRKAIQQDPKAMEELRRAMQGESPR